MTIGIYVLFFENEDRVYIGQSEQVEIRERRHCNSLKRGDHHSSKLQRYYNKYNVLPTLKLIEQVEVRDLDTQELFWINEFDSFTNGFNGTLGGKSPGRGEANTFAEISNLEAIHIMLELANTDKYPNTISAELGISAHIVRNISSGLSWNFLQEEYPEEYAKMLAKLGSRTGTLYEKDKYIEILFRVANTEDQLTYVAKELKVPVDLLYSICSGNSHRYLAEEYPVEYSRMLAKLGSRSSSTRSIPYPALVSPNGMVHHITNVAAFAREYGLHASNITQVLNSNRKSHKGWKLA